MSCMLQQPFEQGVRFILRQVFDMMTVCCDIKVVTAAGFVFLY